jgi:acyl-CoA reductase-like NAD-dependent aldehyde dehydrogenase
MDHQEYPCFIAGRPEKPNLDLEVWDKGDDSLFARVPLVGRAEMERAVDAAHRAAPAMRALRPYERQSLLEACVAKIEERREAWAKVLCAEVGKPIRDARVEVERLLDTFRYAAAEAVRFSGEALNLEIGPRSRGHRGLTQRVPRGPVALITPFNFPFNLIAHKVAPALAVGCPFVLKPASLTPVSALLIGEVLSQIGLPEGAFSILPCRGAEALPLVTDERLKLLSFTGSAEVGWALKQQAGKKLVHLELGGNAACIICEDADLERAADRVLVGAFYQSGQSCISVQRILVHEKVYTRFRDLLVSKTRELRVGDPKQEETFLGPLITQADAERLESWIQSAVEEGAQLLCGGERQGAYLQASLLDDVPREHPLVADEAFGPVAVLSSFSDFDEALAETNDSRFGLQAGLFTRDLQRGLKAFDRLEVGGVVLGDIPSWRVDHMPYGGVKDSGLGREGLRYAMEEMTEMRLLVIRED